MAGYATGLPDLLLDRSLGSIQVPALLRVAGLTLHTLLDLHGSPAVEEIPDQEWLSLAGQRGWPVLMKDQRPGTPRQEVPSALRPDSLMSCWPRPWTPVLTTLAEGGQSAVPG